jgi:hypothetical protein
VSYTARGKIQPYKTGVLRKGSFFCEGKIDVRTGEPCRHKIEIENFDLTYLNDYISEHKLANISLNGGISADVEFSEARGVVSLTGRAETNSLTVFSTAGKHNLVSGENLDLELDMSINTVLNRYTVRKLSLNDGVISLDASGMYVRNDKDDAVKLKFATNAIDLSDLSQTITPYKNVEYSGTLQCDGRFSMDFKKNTAAEMRANAVLKDFILWKSEKGKTRELVGETGMRVKVDGSSIDVDISGKPLQSDIAITGRTRVEGWIPFKSDTRVAVKSKRMNLANIMIPVVYLVNKAYESAYADKRGGNDKQPFLQGALGKFMNNNAIDFTSVYDTVFYGKKARWKNFSLSAKLNRGTLSVGEFGADGYDATYKFSGQGYFNSDQPYVKLEGKIDEFDLERFFAESGMSGVLSGKARADFSYEVSLSRIGDILDNAKGHVNIFAGRGEMKNTLFQRNLMAFLRKNGYDPASISSINFEDISISISETGENFWFSNLGIRGDTLLFNAVGDYLFEGGITSTFGIVIKKDAAPVNIPLRLYGPLLAPCIDMAGKKDSHKLCL